MSIKRAVSPLSPASLLLSLLCAFSATFVSARPMLDTTFGINGTTTIQGVKATDETVTGSLVQQDGKILVAYYTDPIGSRSFLVRFLANGALDNGFGQGGVVVLPALGFTIQQSSDGAIWTAGVRVSSSGTIESTYPVPSTSHYLVPHPDGGMTIVSGASINSSLALRLIRVDRFGNRDSTFAPNGEKVIENLGAGFTIANYEHAVAAYPDGSFLALALTAATPSGPPSDYLLARVTPDGSRDPTFGSDGAVSTRVAGSLPPGDQPQGIFPAPDGKVVISGISLSSQVFLTRVTRMGTLDASFGAQGRIVAIDAAVSSESYFPAVQSNGRIGLVQTSYNPVSLFRNPPDYVRVRIFNEHGQLDTSVGTGGVASISLDDYVGKFAARAIWPDDKGGFVIAGFATASVGCSGSNGTCVRRGIDVAVARVDSSARLVTGFGRGDGFAIWTGSEGSIDEVDTILVEASGHMVLAGDTNEPFLPGYFVERLTPAGTPDAGFGRSGRVVPNLSLNAISSTVRAALQLNGGVVVVAGAGAFVSPNAFRVDGNGVIDPAFSGSSASLAGVIRQGDVVGFDTRPDGRLVYGTVTGGTTVRNVFVQQRLPDGSRDPGFGNNGDVVIPLQNEPSDSSELHVLGDGSVIFSASTANFDTGTRVARIYKLDQQGRLVQSFGTAGEVRIPDVFVLSPNGVVPLADGGFVVIVGSRIPATAPPVWRIVRLDANGRTLSDRPLPSGLTTGETLRNWRLVALPDTSVIMSRSGSISGPTKLYRLLPDDTLDQTFGENGAFVLPGVDVTALAVDNQLRLLVASRNATTAFVARYDLNGGVSAATAIEYYNTILGHYFVTLGPGEIATIDAGGAGPGWQRTGLGFKAFMPESGIPIGAQPVCRFYGTPGVGPNSHFYTANAAECAAVKRDPGWTYEGIAFFVPPSQTERCPGSIPVYRAYNNGYVRNDSNHRYSTQLSALQAMTAQGWSVEGVAFCGGE